jgi:hypothetical protein
MLDKDLNRDIIIRMRDVRAAKQCSRGVRQFFRENGLDWSDFLKNGVKSGVIIDLKDEMGMQVVRCANGR